MVQIEEDQKAEISTQYTGWMMQAKFFKARQRTTGGKDNAAAEVGANASYFLLWGRVCNDRAEKIGRKDEMVYMESSPQVMEKILFPFSSVRVFVMVCTV